METNRLLLFDSEVDNAHLTAPTFFLGFAERGLREGKAEGFKGLMLTCAVVQLIAIAAAIHQSIGPGSAVVYGKRK